MERIKIYTDEDVHSGVVSGLIRRGLEATSTPPHGNLGRTDEEQVRYATALGAVLLTHNIQDFPRLHYEMTERGESHAGIVVARQDFTVGEIIRRTLNLSALLSAEEMVNRLEYLSGW